uniref:Uncharacterized protein n=1 Tax=Avena sativa TaxID=4498 RepID=A0ACD5TXU8_AVESA
MSIQGNASMATTGNPPPASSPPAWILLDSQVSISDVPRRNESTAMAARKNGRAMEVSIRPARPPNPSRLHIHCPNLEPGSEIFVQEPRIVSTAGGLVLLRIGVGCPPTTRSFSFSSRSAGIRRELTDYFVYRLAAGGGLPSLTRLPKPPTRFFQNYEVALLPRGDHFTVAALSAARTGGEFELHLFKSEDWTWDTELVVLLREPATVPEHVCELHITSTVITVGGERGTVGWVDLWRGILLCDLLAENRNLRYVPMPRCRKNHKDKRMECCPRPYRDIAVVEGSLKLVDLEIHGDRLPENDPETEGPNFRFDDWTLTTYTKSKSETSDSWPDDWVTDSTVKASEIEIKETVRSVLLRCGRFCKPNNGEAAERKLQNLHTCQPVLGLDDDTGIVYLLTRLKFVHPHAWILAVDMRNKCVQAMVKIATERSKDLLLAYCASTIVHECD